MGELQACRSGEGHKLSLYLGHWDATAAACRQDAIMQEEGKSWAPGGAESDRERSVYGAGHMSGGLRDDMIR